MKPMLVAACAAAVLVLPLAALARAAPPQQCGGPAGTACKMQRGWCDPAPGRCGSAGLPGVCVPSPGPCVRIYKPVCGCDAKTYGNDCERRNARVARSHEGACK